MFKNTARERIMEVASEFFYREGIRAVGVDTIVAKSGVAKMSLYRSFPSKDDLVAAFPAILADQLLLLLNGAFSTAGTLGGTAPNFSSALLQAAEVLIATQLQ